MRLQNVLKRSQLAVVNRLQRTTEFQTEDTRPTVFELVSRATRTTKSILRRQRVTAEVRHAISDFPHQYVRASLAVDENQYLVLTVSNPTTVELGGVRLRLTYAGRNGAVRVQYHTLSRCLGARRKRRIKTRVGPVRNPMTMQQLSLEVVSARLC